MFEEIENLRKTCTYLPSLFPDPVKESGKNIFQSKMRKETVCFNPGTVYILEQ
jgi:hypothetical protein